MEAWKIGNPDGLLAAAGFEARIFQALVLHTRFEARCKRPGHGLLWRARASISQPRIAAGGRFMSRTRLFLGTQHGLRIWAGDGEEWAEKEKVLAGKVVDTMAGAFDSPDHVFIGIAHEGLYRTTDAGRNWDLVFSGDARAGAVDPVDGRTVYVGTEPVHLYRSRDGGDHWEELDALLQLPEEVKKHWWFPRPPHQGHVRHIFIDRKTARSSIWLWNTAASSGLSMAEKIGRMSAKGSITPIFISSPTFRVIRRSFSRRRLRAFIAPAILPQVGSAPKTGCISNSATT